jgi:queuine tRNA-ribosyltransferase
MTCEVVTTRGGARAILDHATGEVMHPIVGPQHEALNGYVSPSRLATRLREPDDRPLRLFDIGLGAGSLAIAAWHVSEALSASARTLEIVSFDRSRDALAVALDHPADFAFEHAAGDAARALLQAGEHATSRTRWRYVGGDLPSTLAREPEASADIFFWDVFSPRHNPEMWTVAAFRAARRCAAPGATLHTYAGATAARAALLLAGFHVGFGVETAADRIGTIAAVPPAVLDHPLDARWLDRLTRSSAPLPVDAPPDALARIGAAPQFAEHAR